MKKILVLEDVSAGYGDTPIVSGIHMDVAEKEIVTIAGTNGAGKSTLIKAIMGLLPMVTGRIELNGQNLRELPVNRRIYQGIGYVPQVSNVFGTLTVLENLQVVEAVDDRKAMIDKMLTLFPALAERRRTQAENLSGGERQQLAFARALMSRPSLILLDEPSAALSPGLTDQVFNEVKRLPGLGVAVLMVEQRARQALEFSDRGYILDSGRIVLADTAQALLQNQEMADLYIGRSGVPSRHS